MSRIDDIPKENPFNVPKDYFDYLPAEITERVHSKREEKKGFSFNLSIAVPSAAVVFGIVILIMFLFKDTVDPMEEIVLSENEVQDIIDNPESYNIDETAVTEQYLSMNLEDESIADTEDISEDEINSYLEQNADEENIINEL